MSIYCSGLASIDADDCVDYTRPFTSEEAKEAASYTCFGDGRIFGLKDEPCPGCDDCGGLGAPFVYEGSHRMLDLYSPRGGFIDFSIIASHIPTAEEAAAGSDYEDRDGYPKHPWVRVMVGTRQGLNPETIVLHRRQVAYLVAELSEWLADDFLGPEWPAARERIAEDTSPTEGTPCASPDATSSPPSSRARSSS